MAPSRDAACQRGSNEDNTRARVCARARARARVCARARARARVCARARARAYAALGIIPSSLCQLSAVSSIDRRGGVS